MKASRTMETKPGWETATAAAAAAEAIAKTVLAAAATLARVAITVVEVGGLMDMYLILLISHCPRPKASKDYLKLKVVFPLCCRSNTLD